MYEHDDADCRADDDSKKALCVNLPTLVETLQLNPS